MIALSLRTLTTAVLLFLSGRGQALPAPPRQASPTRAPIFVQQPNSPVVTELNASVCLFWQVEYRDTKCTQEMVVRVVSRNHTFQLEHWKPKNAPFDYNLNITEDCVMNQTTTVVNVTLVIVTSEELFSDYTRCNIFNNTVQLVQSNVVKFSDRRNATTPAYMPPTTTDCPTATVGEYSTVPIWVTDTQTTNSALSIRPCLSLLFIIHWGIIILVLSTSFMST